MKSYLFVSTIRIQTALAYRFNVISTILIQCLIMYAMSCFWFAAYSGMGIHPGAIVLLHNMSQTNGEILDELLAKWEDMGYAFRPLSELTLARQ